MLSIFWRCINEHSLLICSLIGTTIYLDFVSQFCQSCKLQLYLLSCDSSYISSMYVPPDDWSGGYRLNLFLFSRLLRGNLFLSRIFSNQQELLIETFISIKLLSQLAVKVQDWKQNQSYIKSSFEQLKTHVLAFN